MFSIPVAYEEKTESFIKASPNEWNIYIIPSIWKPSNIKLGQFTWIDPIKTNEFARIILKIQLIYINQQHVQSNIIPWDYA